MFYTGYLDFWFTDRPLVARVERFVALGIRHFCVFAWRDAPMADLAAECRRHGARLYSTFDAAMGALADPADNELTFRTWAESLEIAVQYDIACLYIFSNQIDRIGNVERVRPLSGNYSQAEQYANLLSQTARILRLVEQTAVEVRVECLSRNHFVGQMAVDTPQLAADWVRRFDHPQLAMVFDCYHQQRDSGNLIWGLEQYAGAQLDDDLQDEVRAAMAARSSPRPSPMPMIADPAFLMTVLMSAKSTFTSPVMP